MQPNPGPLESAQAMLDSPAGYIAARCKHTGGWFEMEVRIPRGIATEIVMPNGTRTAQGAITRISSCDLP